MRTPTSLLPSIHPSTKSVYRFIHLFTHSSHSFIQQILIACLLYCSVVLDASVNKTHTGASPCGAYILVGETDNNQHAS